MNADPRASIPAVERLLETEEGRKLAARFSRGRLTEGLRVVLDEAREAVGRGEWEHDPARMEPYLDAVRLWLEEDARPSLRAVINATGVVLHTNLGRAPLARGARDAMNRVTEGYSNLEFHLETGERGSRYDHCVSLLRELTGAGDALVVNNCAAGLVLALAALARGRDVAVSRGELVEIGGGFRIPDILRQSGARLREVGATNRTRLTDYRAAVHAGGVGALLKVHRSNFRISGFTEEAPVAELGELARESGVPLIHDLGSGLMVDAAALGLPTEPRPRDALEDGASVVIFSGDKLLGGPQAGLVVGEPEAVARMRENPLCRALRVDKGTLAGLEATLRLYRDPERAMAEIPVLALLSASAEALEERAGTLARALRDRVARRGWTVEVAPGTGRVGGGTYPEHPLPGWTVRLSRDEGEARALARRLRTGHPAVVGRLEDDALVLDLRAMLPGEEGTVVARVVAEISGGRRGDEVVR